MGAIGILGFIVWAQLGLLICKCQVIKPCYMLEKLIKISSIFVYFISLYIFYLILNVEKIYKTLNISWKMLFLSQSAGNKRNYYYYDKNLIVYSQFSLTSIIESSGQFGSSETRCRASSLNLKKMKV
jgi:hypothetical protein